MDLGTLGPDLRAIGERIVEARPSCASLVAVEIERDTPVLVVRSPTGERERRIVLWDDDGDLGLGFGGWHTHGNIARWIRDGADELSALTAIALAIIDGELVRTVDVGDGGEGMLDLADPDALVEELTSTYSSGRLRIQAWSGHGDREVSVDDAG